MKNLDELYKAMANNDPQTLDIHGQWSGDLPTFGGDEPRYTEGVWSWDAERLLVGENLDCLRIVTRDEWDE
ncbi:hypothetical protein KKE60_06715 [Patescibacteria group bacterium]|nr:hypothetical protein [Patescibacteria group bacterium]